MSFPNNAWGSCRFPFTEDKFPVKRNALTDTNTILALLANDEQGGSLVDENDNLLIITGEV